ncbi:hypothetical protein BH10PAT1_BH10PAT1_0790 [soil metagenome]
MNKYELVIVLDGKATSAKKKTEVEKVQGWIKEVKGKAETKDWGTKDLAYKMGKSLTGAFTVFQLELNSSSIKEIAEKLRLDNDLIRYLLVRKDK